MYHLYLRAQELFADTTDPIHAREKLPQAAQLLDEAVARDPHFIQAWFLLSRVHGAAYFRGHDHTPARLGLANAAAQTALRLQPDAGEAHLALAIYYYNGFRDYRRARSELVIARRALPNSADVFRYTGMIDRREGHWDEATRNLERALELDPRNFFTLQQLALAYLWQHRYADEVRTYDRALAIMPGDPATRINLALVALNWRADIKPFQAMLATLVAENPGLPLDLDALRPALCERPATAATRALTNYPREGVVNNGVNNPRAYWEGVIARCQGDSAKAQAAFTAARREVEKTVERQPDFAAALSLLGMIDAGLERKEQGIQEGRRACELLPVSKDAIDGAALAINLAQIYAWTGEKDRAIEQIAAVERVPNTLSYGVLKLHPYWDPLRGDPRLRKLSPRSHRSSRNTDFRNVQHRLANSIYPEVLLNQRVLESGCAKRRKPKPGRHETECLAQMAGIKKHHSIGARVMILPHGAGEHCCHQKQSSRVSNEMLAGAIQPCFLGRGVRADPLEMVSRRLIMVQPHSETFDAQWHQIYLAGMTGTARWAGFLDSFPNLRVYK